MSRDRLHDVALNLAIVCGVHEQSTAYEVIVATLDSYAKEELESFVGFLAHAHPDDWRRWVDAGRSQR